MSPASEMISTLRSRLWKSQTQPSRLAEDSFNDPLLLMPDVAPRELLCIYLNDNIRENPKRKVARRMEIQPGKSNPDCSRDVESRSVDNRTSIDPGHGDTLAAVEVNAAVRFSLKADREADLLSHISAGRRVASSSGSLEVLKTIRKEQEAVRALPVATQALFQRERHEH